MLTRICLVLCALTAFLLLGCIKSGRTNNSAGNRNSAPAAVSPSVREEKIGVPECDDFIAKYEACVSTHVPEAQQTQYRENIEGYRSAWRQQLLTNPLIKAALPAACKRHAEQARISMKQYGCEF